MPTNTLRSVLANDRTTYGMWVTLECPNVTEAAIACGIDWIVIEMEHGHLSWREVIDHLRVTDGTQTAALVRVADVTRENVQRTLDLGADGLILPMIDNADQLARAFDFARYPPRGRRGVGGERCVRWGLETASYLQSANEETLVIPLLETRGAVENLNAILAIDGLEAVFFGPADLSASHGFLGQWEGGDLSGTLLEMLDAVRSAGLHAGILGRNPAEVDARIEQGFRMIGLGADVNLMMRSLQQSLAAAKGEL